MLDWGEEQGFADKIGSYSVKGARGATPYEQLPGDTVEMAKDFAGDIEKACSGEEW